MKSLIEIQFENLKGFHIFNWLKKQIKSPGKQRFILEESWVVYFDDSQNKCSCANLKFQNASNTYYLTDKFLLEMGEEESTNSKSTALKRDWNMVNK